MGEFFVYILKSSLCLSVFYLFYRLLLSRETFHSFNRVVLIAIFSLSVIIPFIQFSFNNGTQIAGLSLNLDTLIAMAANTPAEDAALNRADSVNYWPTIALIIYLTGVVVATGISVLSFIRMFTLLTNKNTKKKSIGGGVTLIIHKESVSPFSWMRYIAINESDYNENAREILSHEMAHIKGFHSLDIIIAELMRIVHWFNPAAWLLKQEIRSIHEFQADEAVINNGIDAKQYQLLLIKKAVGDRLYTMANSFNHSKLKNRITMITKKKSTRSASLKAIFVLPLTLFAVILFADEKVTYALEPVSNVKITDLIQKDTTKEVSKSVIVILKGDTAASAKGDKTDSTKKVKVRMVLNGKDTSSMVYNIALKDSLKPSVIVIDNKIIKAENKNEIKVVKGEMTVLWDAMADDKNPLIVVNGEIQKPTFDISNLSSESIKSITILKDKSALSLYGTKGKNGVIVITLKEGAQKIDGNPEVNKEIRVIGINQIDINSPDSVKSEIRIKSTGNVQTPIYVINGEVLKEGFDINTIKPENISSINVFKDKLAIEKYGERAKNGVIEITLKEGALLKDGKGVKPVEAVSPVAADKHKAQDKSAGVAKSKGINNPLYVVDGEIMKKGFDIANITPESIASVTILKDKTAIDKYGEKGRDGVIEITLKK